MKNGLDGKCRKLRAAGRVVIIVCNGWHWCDLRRDS